MNRQTAQVLFSGIKNFIITALLQCDNHELRFTPYGDGLKGCLEPDYSEIFIADNEGGDGNVYVRFNEDAIGYDEDTCGICDIDDLSINDLLYLVEAFINSEEYK